MKRKLCSALILCFVFVPLLNLAQAATVRIDKPKIRLTIACGQTESGVINIENPSEEAATVRVYLEDWLYSSTLDGSKEFFPPNTTALSCADWISFAPSEFTIPPFAKTTVNYTVNCPDDARGGHYAVMFFETALGQAQDQQGVTVNVLGRLGALFCVEPKGSIIREGKLDNFSIVENEGIEIKMDFINVGNVDIAPEGTFYLMDKEGIIIARGKFEKTYTLPGDKSTITSKITQESAGAIPSGEYDLIITLDLGAIPKTLEARLSFDPSGKFSYFLP